MAPPVVLITGCSEGGIGYDLCKAFAAAGCKVYATARRVEAMAGLPELGIETLALDVTSRDSVGAAVATAVERAGHIDVLVNNAGQGCIGPLLEMPLDNMRACFEANVFGTINMVQAVAPHMVARGKGKIVNFGSIVGYVATPFAGTYCASKAAVHSFTDTLRLELKPFGVQTLLIAPGAIRSNIGSTNMKFLEGRKWSIYSPFASIINERANASQSSRSTPASVFAADVVKQVLRPAPPLHYTAGYMSGMFYVLRWLPRWALDYFLAKRYKLDGSIDVQPVGKVE